jgi:hypothetical protein
MATRDFYKKNLELELISENLIDKRRKLSDSSEIHKT